MLLLGFAALDKEDQLAMQFTSNEPVKPREIQTLRQRLRSQILAKGQDLIEVDEDTDTVGFIHRTVVDFFELQETGSQIRHWAGSDFDLWQSLCEIYFLLARRMELLNRGRYDPKIITGPLSNALDFARQIEHEQQRSPHHELKLLSSLPLAHPQVRHWHRKGYDAVPMTQWAISSGLTLFITDKVADGSLDPSASFNGQPLLSFAVLERFQFSLPRIPSEDMVDMLLRLGNSPNDLCLMDELQCSVWSLLLAEIFDNVKGYPKMFDRNRWLRTCELFIAARALDPNTPGLNSAGALEKLFSDPVSEREILQEAFGVHEADRLLALRPQESKETPTRAIAEATGGQKRGLLGKLVSLLSR